MANTKYKSADYRPDIDGLRAIAVLSVVFYHYFPLHTRGGFVGVDIFFVISGFLISTIIIKNIDSSISENNIVSFNFIEFYTRRIRRIFPVLIIVLLCSLIAGWLTLLPDELKQLGKHIWGGATYISNIMLWFETGYFDTASYTKPLLHLWSLGVEEQFYLVWPLLVFLLYKLKLNNITFIIIFIVTSFIIDIYLIKWDISAAFYFPHSRFWELMCGGLLANICYYYEFSADNKFSILITNIIYNKKYNKNKIFIGDITSIIGILLILFSILFIDNSNNFPGFYALFPVIGAILIIFSGKNAIINKYILSNKIAIWFGIISYPLYLWHWPFLSFAKIINAGDQPTRIVRIILLGISILCAWITYKFIEPRLRYGGHGRIKAVSLFIIVCLIGISGYCIQKENGYPERIIDKIQIQKDNILYNKLNRYEDVCHEVFPLWKDYSDQNLCMIQNKSHTSIALIGDSHSRHLYPGIIEKIDNSYGVSVFPASGAAPYIDIMTLTRNIKDERLRYIREKAHILINNAYKYILNNNDIKLVILAHNPNCSFNDSIDVRNKDEKNSTIIMESAMRRTFSLLKEKNKKVIVILDSPTLPYNPKICETQQRPLSFLNTNEPNECKRLRKNDEASKALNWYNNIIFNIAKEFDNITIFNTFDSLCDNEFCYTNKKNKTLYRDRDHLNYNGSRIVANDLVPFILKNID